MPVASGYSGTPLARKLGIKEGMRVSAVDAPTEYQRWLAPLPPGVVFDAEPGAHSALVHLFTDRAQVLRERLTTWRASLAPSCPVWVSWPKKAAKVPTDITEDVIRASALPAGWVDIKVCAVSDVWSGLKLVLRTSLRR